MPGRAAGSSAGSAAPPRPLCAAQNGTFPCLKQHSSVPESYESVPPVSQVQSSKSPLSSMSFVVISKITSVSSRCTQLLNASNDVSCSSKVLQKNWEAAPISMSLCRSVKGLRDKQHPSGFNHLYIHSYLYILSAFVLLIVGLIITSMIASATATTILYFTFKNGPSIGIRMRSLSCMQDMHVLR